MFTSPISQEDLQVLVSSQFLHLPNTFLHFTTHLTKTHCIPFGCMILAHHLQIVPHWPISQQGSAPCPRVHSLYQLLLLLICFKFYSHLLTASISILYYLIAYTYLHLLNCIYLLLLPIVALPSFSRVHCPAKNHQRPREIEPDSHQIFDRRVRPSISHSQEGPSTSRSN